MARDRARRRRTTHSLAGVDTAGDLLSALLAIPVWPRLLAGVDLHVDLVRTGGGESRPLRAARGTPNGEVPRPTARVPPPAAAPAHLLGYSVAAMAGERVKIDVQPRTRRGSADARRLRREGFVPGVLYGREDPAAFVVAERELRRVLTGPAGLHAILDVALDGGQTRPAILKEYQQDPVRGRLLHVDLQEVRLDQAITASVAITLLGGEDAPGVREGGVLSQVAREITVEALPMEIPDHLDVDVSEMEIGGTLRLAELTAPEGVSFLDDPDETVIATITAPTRAIEDEEAEAAAAEAAEAAEEGEEAPEEGAAEEPAADEPGTVEG